MNITEFRKQYPGYDHVDDETLSSKLHEKYYNHVDKNEFLDKFLVSDEAMEDVPVEEEEAVEPVPTFEEPSVGGFIEETLLGEEGKLIGLKNTADQYGSRIQDSFSKAGAGILEVGQEVAEGVKDWWTWLNDEEKETTNPALTKRILEGGSLDEVYSSPEVQADLADKANRKLEKEKAKRNSVVGELIASAETAGDFWGVDKSTQRAFSELDDVEGVLNKAIVLAEVGLGDVADSTGDLATIFASAPTFVMSHGYETAKKIAKNQGQDKVSAEHMALGIANGIVQGYTDKFFMNRSLKADTYKRLGTLAVANGMTEVPAELFDASIVNYGTDKELSESEIKEIATRSFVAGGLTSGAIGAIPATVGQIQAPAKARAEAEKKKQIELATEELKKIDAENAAILEGKKAVEAVKQQTATRMQELSDSLRANHAARMQQDADEQARIEAEATTQAEPTVSQANKNLDELSASLRARASDQKLQEEAEAEAAPEVSQANQNLTALSESLRAREAERKQQEEVDANTPPVISDYNARLNAISENVRGRTGDLTPTADTNVEATTEEALEEKPERTGGYGVLAKAKGVTGTVKAKAKKNQQERKVRQAKKKAATTQAKAEADPTPENIMAAEVAEDTVQEVEEKIEVENAEAEVKQIEETQAEAQKATVIPKATPSGKRFRPTLADGTTDTSVNPIYAVDVNGETRLITSEGTGKNQVWYEVSEDNLYEAVEGQKPTQYKKTLLANLQKAEPNKVELTEDEVVEMVDDYQAQVAEGTPNKEAKEKAKENVLTKRKAAKKKVAKKEVKEEVKEVKKYKPDMTDAEQAIFQKAVDYDVNINKMPLKEAQKSAYESTLQRRKSEETAKEAKEAKEAKVAEEKAAAEKEAKLQQLEAEAKQSQMEAQNPAPKEPKVSKAPKFDPEDDLTEEDIFGMSAVELRAVAKSRGIDTKSKGDKKGLISKKALQNEVYNHNQRRAEQKLIDENPNDRFGLPKRDGTVENSLARVKQGQNLSWADREIAIRPDIAFLTDKLIEKGEKHASYYFSQKVDSKWDSDHTLAYERVEEILDIEPDGFIAGEPRTNQERRQHLQNLIDAHLGKPGVVEVQMKENWNTNALYRLGDKGQFETYDHLLGPLLNLDIDTDTDLKQEDDLDSIMSVIQEAMKDKRNDLAKESLKWTTADQALQYIIDNSQNPSYVLLAKYIKKHIGKTKFTAVDMKNFAKVTAPAQKMFGKKTAARGKFVPEENKIYIRASGDVNEMTIIHEALHAATAERIFAGLMPENADTPLGRNVKKLQDLYDSVTDRMNDIQEAADAGFTELTKEEAYLIKVLDNSNGVHELLAHGMTDPKTQAILKDMDYDRKSSIWTKIKSYLFRVFGVRAKDQNAFTALLEYFPDVQSSDIAGVKLPERQSNLNMAGYGNLRGASNTTKTTNRKATPDSVEPDKFVLKEPTNDSYGDLAARKASTWLERTKDSVMEFIEANGSEDFLAETLEYQGLDDAMELANILQMQEGDAHASIDQSVKEVLDYAVKMSKESQKRVADLSAQATMKGDLLLDTIEYKSMSPEEKVLYDRWYKHNKLKGELMYGAVKKNLEQGDLTKEQSKDAQKLLTTLRHSLDNTIYFPLQRHGDYRLAVKLANGTKYVSRSNTKKELAAEMKDLTSKGATVEEVSDETGVEEEARWVMDSAAFEKMKRLVEDSLQGKSEDSKKAAKSAIWNLYLDMARPTHLKERTAKRWFVSGASADMVRNIGQSIGHFDGIFKMYYASDRAKTLQKIEGQLEEKKRNITAQVAGSKEQSEAMNDYFKASRLVRELQKREVQRANYRRNAFSKAATKVSFYLNLASNPSTALINLTQPHIVGIPVLGSKYGAARSAKEITKAQLTALKSRGRMDKIKKFITPLEGKMLDRIAAAGRIGASQAAMHMDMADADAAVKQGGWALFNKIAGYTQHRTEVANRQATALAAYRMAKQGTKTTPPMSHDEAVDYAYKTVHEVNFNFAESGKSRIQRHSLGAVALNFKSHPIKMLEFQIRQFRIIADQHGATPEQKTEARYKLSGMYLMMFGFAGALGMPLAGALRMVYQVLGDEEDESFETWVDNSLEPYFGKEGSYAVRHGIVAAALGIEMTSRVGLNESVINLPQNITSAEDWVRAMSSTLGGPVGARVGALPRAAKQFDQGDPAGAVRTIMGPVLTNNLTDAAKWYADESAHDRFGNQLDADFTAIDAAVEAFGFTSKDIYEKKRLNWETKWTERRIENAKRVLIRDYNNANIGKSQAEINDALDAIDEWNRQHPDYTITRSTLRKSFKRFANTWDDIED